jgi:putative zinc finger/helix-turn-helix YgiT family protein
MKDNFSYCDICQSKTSTFVAPKKYDFNHNGKFVSFLADALFCETCKNQMYDYELDNQASLKAIAHYNLQYGISGKTIIDFRNQYNISQSTFSKIIGIAKKTLVSYETEQAIPNDHFLQILRIVINNPNTLELFAKNSSSYFTEKELLKINAFSFTSQSMYLREDSMEYQGYNSFKIQKIIDMILFFCQNGATMTKLNKALFYADFSHYHHDAVSITGLSYQKADKGPFVSTLYQLVDKLLVEGKLIKETIDLSNYKYQIYKSKEKISLKNFDDLEKSIIKEIQGHLLVKTSKHISDESHEEEAWLLTEDGAYISYHHANTLKKIYGLVKSDIYE